MREHAMGSDRVQPALGILVGTVSHVVGFVSGVLAVLALSAAAGAALWLKHLVTGNTHLHSMAGGALLLAAVSGFIGAWRGAAAATRRAMLEAHNPAKREPKAPRGQLESAYRFLDANGAVLLQTQDAQELKEALYSGRIRPETLCQPILASGEPEQAQPLRDSKLTRHDFVSALLNPLDHYGTLGGGIGVSVGLWGFIAVWIAATCQGNLAGLSWPAYIGAVIAIAAGAMGACAGIGVVWAQSAAEDKIHIAESLGHAAAGQPLGQGWRAAIGMVSGLVLGGLVMLSVRSF